MKSRVISEKRKHGLSGARTGGADGVRLLQAEVQRHRPEPEVAQLQALLLSAVHEDEPHQRAGPLLRLLLEAHRNRRSRSGGVAHVRARLVSGQEFRSA